jgi:hypothetical protein
LSVGSHNLTAAYVGSTSFTASSGSTTAAVSQDSTSTRLAALPGTAVFGQAVTFQATVSAASPGRGKPTGTVTFQEGSTTLATVSLVAGIARYVPKGMSLGSHTLTVTYNADKNFIGSSATATATIKQDSTTTAPRSSANPAVFGQSVTITARVTANAPGSGTPTGTVTFEDGSTILTTTMLDATGRATYTNSGLSVGSHAISMVYSGDGTYLPSTSLAMSQGVSRDSTTTALVSSLNPSALGLMVTFTASVSANAPGSGAPTGSVTFKDGTSLLGTATLDVNGNASWTASSLGAGAHTIIAIYNGDTDFLKSVAPPLTQQVVAPGGAAVRSGTGAALQLHPSLVSAGSSTVGTTAGFANGLNAADPSALASVAVGSPSATTSGSTGGMTLQTTNLASSSVAAELVSEAGEGWGTIRLQRLEQTAMAAATPEATSDQD